MRKDSRPELCRGVANWDCQMWAKHRASQTLILFCTLFTARALIKSHVHGVCLMFAAVTTSGPAIRLVSWLVEEDIITALNIEMHLFDLLFSADGWDYDNRGHHWACGQCDQGDFTASPAFGVRCKCLKRSPEHQARDKIIRRDEVCGGLGRDKEALWSLCPSVLAPAASLFTQWLHAPLAPRPLHLPPDALLCIFSPSLHQQGCGPLPAWLAQPTHNICVLFHPNLNLKIVLSCCTRAANCAPNMSVLSVVSLGCQDRERRERRGVRPHWLRWSAVSWLDLLSASRRHFY